MTLITVTSQLKQETCWPNNTWLLSKKIIARDFLVASLPVCPYIPSIAKNILKSHESNFTYPFKRNKKPSASFPPFPFPYHLDLR